MYGALVVLMAVIWNTWRPGSELKPPVPLVVDIAVKFESEILYGEGVCVVIKAKSLTRIFLLQNQVHY